MALPFSSAANGGIFSSVALAQETGLGRSASCAQVGQRQEGAGLGRRKVDISIRESNMLADVVIIGAGVFGSDLARCVPEVGS